MSDTFSLAFYFLTKGRRTYRNLIPRLQRAIRLARRANFLLYGDVGYTISLPPPTTHHPVELNH